VKLGFAVYAANLFTAYAMSGDVVVARYWREPIRDASSALRSSLKTGKRPEKDWTKTGKDWTSSLVF